MKRNIILLCFFLLQITGFSQPTIFLKNYDTLGYYYSNCVRQTLDGGYIMCGSNYTTVNTQDAAIIKTDSFGNLEWIKTYGGFATDGAITLEVSNDSSYFVFGIKDDISSWQNDFWFLKLNSQGDTVFTKILSFGPGVNYPKGSDRTLDNGYVITGYTTAIGSGLHDVFLVKLDSIGNSIWIKTYGGTNGDYGNSVRQTSDSGYIVTGYTGSFNTLFGDIYTIKTDKYGDTLWTRTFGFGNYDFGQSIAETSDHGFLVAGASYDTGGTNYNTLLLRYDSIGELLWSKEFFIPVEDVPIAIYKLSSGGFILGGYRANAVTHHYQVFLMQIDDFGDSLWTRTSPLPTPTTSDIALSMILNRNGDYVFVGASDDPPNSGFLMIVDTSGNFLSKVLEIPMVNNYLIYPNPANSFLSIENMGILNSATRYELVNLFGNIVTTNSIEKGLIATKINVSEIPSGIYFIRIYKDNNILQVTKLIIVHPY